MDTITLPRPWPAEDSPSSTNSAPIEPSPATTSCRRTSLQTDGPHGSPSEFSLPRPANHRRSLNHAASKPLRSSPLAGPVLEIKEEENLRPSRTTSTPDLTSLLTPPPRLRHARPKTADNALGVTRFSTSLSPRLLEPSSRSSLRGELGRDLGEQMARPTIQTPPESHSSSSLSALRRPPSMVESLRNRQPPLSSATQRPKSAHGYPILETPLEPTPNSIPQIPTRDPADTSWLTTNSYEVTPKFSRLGLASSNVVLPLSAKEHKRMSRQSSKSSVITTVTGITRTDTESSSPNNDPANPVQVTPSLRPTRSSGFNPRSEALQASPRPRTRALSSVIVDITTIIEGEEPSRPGETSSEPHRPPTKPTPDVASKKGLIGRLRTFAPRPVRSPNSLLGSRIASINEKVKMKSQSKIILGLSTDSSNSSTSGSIEESKTPSSPSMASSNPSKKVSGVRRIWKSITGNWQLNRSH